MADFIDEVIVTVRDASLRHQADRFGHAWWVHEQGDEHNTAYFGSADELRQFLVASLAALDEWEARRG